jgi:hypothetical protein
MSIRNKILSFSEGNALVKLIASIPYLIDDFQP